MTIKTPYTAKNFPKQLEVSDKPSLTIPDQSMTIQTILERYARGLPIDGAKEAIYYGEDEEIPDLRTLDISERMELLEETKQKVKHYQKQLSNASKKKGTPPESTSTPANTGKEPTAG